MQGTCKIVNFPWLLLAALMIGRNLLTQRKNTLKKWSLKTFYFVNCLFEVFCTLCVKNKIFLCEESVLRHNKRNCFPYYADRYLGPFCCSELFCKVFLVKYTHQYNYIRVAERQIGKSYTWLLTAWEKSMRIKRFFLMTEICNWK